MSAINTDMPFDKDSVILFRIPITDIPIRLSTIKYTTFLLSGIASLWPWNCFLSASDYFQDRFKSNPILSNNYSSTMMTISTITSTLFNYYLSRNQNNINYMNRLKNGNYLQMIIFLIMTISILIIPKNWINFYFIFVMLNVLVTSIGSCLTQVGMMALVNIEGSFYANATVVGNAIAGVLPSISMILAVISNPLIDLNINNNNNNKIETEIQNSEIDRSSDAIKYFITSVLMAILAQISIFIMEYYEKKSIYIPELNNEETENEEIETLEDRIGETNKLNKNYIGFKQLWSKLKYVELTIILTFSLTLIFPVFASNVESIKISKKLFVPLAFLIWNIGDLFGRIICAIPFLLIKREIILISYSILRLLFIPLFLMCNINNKGNNKIGDFGYLLIQFLFGLTNGQLFSSSYMCVGGLLDTKDEQRAAAAFTALLINVSLLVGSLASFVVVYYCL